MEATSESTSTIKQRHGCVTTWLILMIVLNSFTALLYIFGSDSISKNIPGGISNTMTSLLVILGLLNVVFAFMLLRWKKIGFWGFILTSLVAFAVNLSIGQGAFQSLLGLIGIVILYGILQIKKDNVTAWANLE